MRRRVTPAPAEPEAAWPVWRVALAVLWPVAMLSCYLRLVASPMLAALLQR